MQEEPSWLVGQFVWRELMTPDEAKARDFYGQLFGWTFEELNMGAFVYSIIKRDGRSMGGMVALGPRRDPPPHWKSYVSVKDVDAAASAAKAQGGTVFAGPGDIPGVGRFAVVGDPDGAWLGLLHRTQGDGPQPEHPGAGDFCWETVSSNDPAEVARFYGAVLGWKVVPGPGGNGEVFATEGDMQVADLQPARNMSPCWLNYVLVESLEAATEKAKGLGANILVPRIDVSHVGSMALIADPSGAVLGLFEPRLV